jgi:hypothetical protein
MDMVRIFPKEYWWKLLMEKGAVAYFYFPIVSGDERNGHKTEMRRVLIRGSVISIRKNRFGVTVVRIRVHAKCRLYEEMFLSADEIAEIDLRLIIGVDHKGALLFP